MQDISEKKYRNKFVFTIVMQIVLATYTSFLMLPVSFFFLFGKLCGNKNHRCLSTNVKYSDAFVNNIKKLLIYFNLNPLSTSNIPNLNNKQKCYNVRAMTNPNRYKH